MGTSFERLDYGSVDGSRWGGASTDKIAFYGVTPVSRIGVSTAISTTVSVSANATTFQAYGFSTSSEAMDFVNAISTIASALVSTGLFYNLR